MCTGCVCVLGIYVCTVGVCAPVYVCVGCVCFCGLCEFVYKVCLCARGVCGGGGVCA